MYIYIYIYNHLGTDCFVVSQLFSVTRHVGHFKLRLKATQLYVRLRILLLSPQLPYFRLGIIRHYVVAIVCLHFALPHTRMLNSYQKLCIRRIAVVNSLARVLNPLWGMYILSSTDSLLCCIASMNIFLFINGKKIF